MNAIQSNPLCDSGLRNGNAKIHSQLSLLQSLNQFKFHLKLICLFIINTDMGLSWCPGLERLLASAALLRTAPGPGTDYQRPSDHQNRRYLHSSASARPTRLFEHQTVLAAAVGVVCRSPALL